MKIMLQFPEGLKRNAIAKAKELEAEGHIVFIASAPCYGACDICLDEARAVGAQKIIHFGHAEFMPIKSDIEIEYVPHYETIPEENLHATMKKAIVELKDYKKVGLVTTVQHIKQITDVEKLLVAAGKTIITEKGGVHVRHQGQVLGCDAISAVLAAKEADCILYFGGGKFHPLGIPALKPVLVADPYLGSAYWITQEIEKLRKRRQGAILMASKSKRFGIIVSTKVGQFNLSGAALVKKKLAEKGREGYLLVSNEIHPISVANFNSFDAYINTACPRIGDDHDVYDKPIVDLTDFKRLLELMV
jgi:2-(3-amino-3-carboxypropyl)histidine synthase